MVISFLGLLIFGLPFILAVCYFVGRWAVAPLRRSPPHPLPPTQFQITDGYVLMGQFSLIALVLLAAQTGKTGWESLIPLLPLWMLCAWTWWLGIRWLSWSGVRAAAKRAWVLGCAMPLAFLVLPLVLAGPLTIVRMNSISASGGVTAAPRDVFLIYGLEVPTPAGNWSGLILTMLLCLLFGVAFYAARTLAVWAVQGSQGRHEALRSGESPA